MRFSRGFSLIEMVIVVIVLGIIAAAAAPMAVSTLSAYNNIQNDLVTLDKVRYVTERLARELREVAYDSSAGTYSFTTISSTAPVFKKSGSAFTATISGTTMTVTSVTYGTIEVGQTITAGAAANTTVSALGTGSGGTGTYTVSVSQTVASATVMTATGVTVTVSQAVPNVRLNYSTPSFSPAPILTDQMSSLTFTFFDKDGHNASSTPSVTITTANVKYVEISLTLTQGSQSYTERTRVQLRNQ